MCCICLLSTDSSSCVLPMRDSQPEGHICRKAFPIISYDLIMQLISAAFADIYLFLTLDCKKQAMHGSLWVCPGYVQLVGEKLEWSL